MLLRDAENERPVNDGHRKLKDRNLADWKITDKVSGSAK